MNLSLIDPFLLMRELPEALETTLSPSLHFYDAL
jgi:hypothetical protein